MQDGIATAGINSQVPNNTALIHPPGQGLRQQFSKANKSMGISNNFFHEKTAAE
ncbi:hypothetical protein [Dialister succinatiphilus]|uniref:hypothetical protein n=1 Tax=Dialister succinatiphilus TaxID=487173 RepID=UPI004028CB5D